MSMQILDNINSLWGDDLKQAISRGSKLKIAASCFSIYAYEALKGELEFILRLPPLYKKENPELWQQAIEAFSLAQQEDEQHFWKSNGFDGPPK